ncbi:MAG: TAT-variant-translocated molybdopterin oxidoreductase [Acidobacteria bacterium]|nr:TAT-variant-translocated molybdopterin oxidoreductase [Acidobacteriota bacterium]
MMTYWKSIEEFEGGPEIRARAETEFEDTPLRITAGPDRRGFLKAAGFAFAGATLSGCRQAPVEKAIPLLRQVEGMSPGRPYYYASTCSGCPAGCGLLTKTRDGRPIKLEGNAEHPLSRGGLCAVGQASILSLYDGLRLKQPLRHGKEARWDEVDAEIAAQFDRIRKEKRAVRILTATIASPTLNAVVRGFVQSFPNAQHIVCDPQSASPILESHQLTHGARILPRYRFDKAEVIVSFDADFLGTWISPVEFTQSYSAGRQPDAKPPRMSHHTQLESRMSVTGSKADRRYRLSPGEVPQVIEQLALRVARRTGAAADWAKDAPVALATKELDELAERLVSARGRSLVVCGLADTGAQVLCNYLNHLLGNYGTTLDVEAPSRQRQGDDRAVARLLEEIAGGKVAALVVPGVNPLADLPGGDVLRRVPLLVSLSPRLDETASVATYVCPDSDPLESWGDTEAVSGIASLMQPAVQTLAQTRPAVETLARWAGGQSAAYDLVRTTWKREIHPRSTGKEDFEAFWRKSLHDGVAAVRPQNTAVKPFDVKAVRPLTPTPAQDLTLVLYSKPSIPDGRHAYNPWLQELPDPVSKCTWDNYACLAPSTAERLKVKEGDVVRLEAGGHSLELPALLQPGQHEKVIAVALGYGRKESARFAGVGPGWLFRRPSLGEKGLVGGNASSFLRFEDGALRYWRSDLRLTDTGKLHPLALTQNHHTLSVPKHLDPGGGSRPIVQETRLVELSNVRRETAADKSEEDLWPRDHPFTGHRWALAVDLSACTGCSACVVACQVENNIPVVGKDEVIRNREMHWLRLDRYYSGDPTAPQVAHQPMMCQQCEHASCETVCPVLATVHSEEGLNQQIYNRCVGTRYCANNCAFKARRFNWFEYAREDRLANLVLNPDVTVRSRGVMEKCTFCVQRIQDAKIEAKRERRALRDGEIQTACQQSCPAQAIVFGDWNDPNSRLSKWMNSLRRYRVLEEINVRPSVGYLKVVRQGETNEGGSRHG